MRTSRKLLAAAGAAAAAFSIIPLSQAGAAPVHPSVSAGVTAGVTGVAKAGGSGWQGNYTYSVPTGTGTLFFHYGCAAGFFARSGGANPDAVSQNIVRFIAEGPRHDLGSANLTEWYWLYQWPNGAPAGSTVQFDVNCTKSPA